LRQLGQYQKLARAQNRTTISKFSLAKSLKHTVDIIGLTYLSQFRVGGLVKDACEDDGESNGDSSRWEHKVTH
jgi:hypothetical protein